MSRLARRLWSLASLCGALLAAAPAVAGPQPWIEIASDPRPPFDLVAPAPGAVLAAGSTVEFAWVARPGFDRFAGIDEWEAFLSVDGGASYPVRITPHLDRDLRRVLWRVPALPSRDARLMLRFGDEGRETAYFLPHRFIIAGTSGAQAAPAGVTLGRG
ncbi:MAG TPA: hypothetical protein VMW27_12435, partial [Thermoanaerobaculia bacterium]|nr:hypothetical protein [Thermoanaerobaculia bacterium]